MSTIKQTGIPHVRTVGFPLTITLTAPDHTPVDLTGATDVVIEIEKRGAEDSKIVHDDLDVGVVIPDPPSGQIIYTMRTGDFPIGGGKYRIIITITFAPGEILAAEGDIDTEG